jgi:hypothetical protein
MTVPAKTAVLFDRKSRLDPTTLLSDLFSEAISIILKTLKLDL